MHIVKLLAALALSLTLGACGKAKETETVRPAPEGLTVSQLSETTAQLQWTDSQSGVTGYRVYLRDEASGFHVPPLNQDSPLPADARSYTFEDLKAGKTYSFGVQSLAANPSDYSKVVYSSDYKMLTALEAGAAEGSHIAAPAEVEVSAGADNAVNVSWMAGDNKAVEYIVYVRTQDQESFSREAARVPAGETTCTVTGLAPGVYIFGVQALAQVLSESSAVTSAPAFRLQDASKMPVINNVSATYAYVMVNYTLRTSATYPEHGLCFSSEGVPDMGSQVIWGPQLPANKTVSQLIPNAVLDYGKDYQVCAYIKTGDSYYYSNPVTVRLGAEPALPELTWTRVSNPAGVPAGVEVYATETPLNGRPFKAWYAVADCTGDIEMRVVPQTSLTTIDKISASYKGDCYVLINGGYFAWDSGWSSPYVSDGVRTGDGYGSSRVSDANWTLTTPAVVGVDKEGHAAAYWWSARPSKAYYYTLPQPTVPDQAKYWYESNDTQLSSFPGPDQKWEPYNAISAGPMVLYDGKVVVDHSHNGEWYTTNYELLASDIFPGYSPDRTAIGILEDGRIVLFVCDGRVDESDGASLPELGLVMKSIGCVAAQNLDGGGSTGMMLGETHLNTWEQGKGSARKKEYRAVKTALGFFKRR